MQPQAGVQYAGQYAVPTQGVAYNYAAAPYYPQGQQQYTQENVAYYATNTNTNQRPNNKKYNNNRNQGYNNKQGYNNNNQYNNNNNQQYNQQNTVGYENQANNSGTSQYSKSANGSFDDTNINDTNNNVSTSISTASAGQAHGVVAEVPLFIDPNEPHGISFDASPILPAVASPTFASKGIALDDPSLLQSLTFTTTDYDDVLNPNPVACAKTSTTTESPANIPVATKHAHITIDTRLEEEDEVVDTRVSFTSVDAPEPAPVTAPISTPAPAAAPVAPPTPVDKVKDKTPSSPKSPKRNVSLAPPQEKSDWRNATKPKPLPERTNTPKEYPTSSAATPKVANGDKGDQGWKRGEAVPLPITLAGMLARDDGIIRYDQAALHELFRRHKEAPADLLYVLSPIALLLHSLHSNRQLYHFTISLTGKIIPMQMPMYTCLYCQEE